MKGREMRYVVHLVSLRRREKRGGMIGVLSERQIGGLLNVLGATDRQKDDLVARAQTGWATLEVGKAGITIGLLEPREKSA